jgi:hypothetical protein
LWHDIKRNLYKKNENQQEKISVKNENQQGKNVWNKNLTLDCVFQGETFVCTDMIYQLVILIYRRWYIDRIGFPHFHQLFLYRCIIYCIICMT